MKIGILTLPLHTNYGGILQAYALQTVLERMGHEVIVIDKPQHVSLPVWKWPYSYPKQYIFSKQERIFYEQYYNRAHPLSAHTSYGDSHLPTGAESDETNLSSYIECADGESGIKGITK